MFPFIWQIHLQNLCWFHLFGKTACSTSTVSICLTKPPATSLLIPFIWQNHLHHQGWFHWFNKTTCRPLLIPLIWKNQLQHLCWFHSFDKITWIPSADSIYLTNPPAEPLLITIIWQNCFHLFDKTACRPLLIPLIWQNHLKVRQVFEKRGKGVDNKK